MKSYFVNVFRLFRKHYAEELRAYAILLGVFVAPLLLTLLTGESSPVYTTSKSFLVIAIAFVVERSTRALRSRYHSTMGMTLPVSTAERYGFIMLNSTVVVVAAFALLNALSIAIATAIYPLDRGFEWVAEYNFYTNPRSWLGLACTQAIFLLVALNRRFKPTINAIIALAVVFVAQLIIVEMTANPEMVKMWCNIIVTITAWVAGYFMLKKYEFR